MLAGISVEYYTRLERGNANGVSEDVLEGVVPGPAARRSRTGPPVRPRPHRVHQPPAAAAPAQERVRPTVQQILDSMTDTPPTSATAASTSSPPTALGHALYADVFDDPVQPPNTARFLFLDPRATEFFVDWDTIAHDAVAILRAEAGRDPHDRRLSDLIGELATRSEEFRVRWAAHNVKFHRTGTKRFHHPVVGDLTLTYEALDLPADSGQRMLVYTAEPGSPSHDAMRLLASWATTPAAATATEPTTTAEPRSDRRLRSPTSSPGGSPCLTNPRPPNR